MSKTEDDATSKRSSSAEDIRCMGNWTQKPNDGDLEVHLSSTGNKEHGRDNVQGHTEARSSTALQGQNHGDLVDSFTEPKMLDKSAIAHNSTAPGSGGSTTYSETGEPDPMKRFLHGQSNEGPWHPGRHDGARHTMTDKSGSANPGVKEQKSSWDGSSLEQAREASRPA